MATPHSNSPTRDGLPPKVREALARFEQDRDPVAFECVARHVVTTFMASGMNLPAGPLTDEMRLVEDLGLDSLALAELVFFVEDVFGLVITNEALRRIDTIGRLREHISHELGAIG